MRGRRGIPPLEPLLPRRPSSAFRPATLPLDQVIEQEIYRAEKSKLLFKKKSLEEKISSLLQKQNDWLEPMQEWIKDAQNLNGIARDSNLFNKKVAAKEIFGSNLLLGEKTVRTAFGGAPNSFGKMGGNQWDALRASHLLASKKPLRSLMVRNARIELAPTAWEAVVLPLN